jgi:hypothetical protein
VDLRHRYHQVALSSSTRGFRSLRGRNIRAASFPSVFQDPLATRRALRVLPSVAPWFCVTTFRLLCSFQRWSLPAVPASSMARCLQGAFLKSQKAYLMHVKPFLTCA